VLECDRSKISGCKTLLRLILSGTFDCHHDLHVVLERNLFVGLAGTELADEDDNS
jgi:hypothetical protein